MEKKIFDHTPKTWQELEEMVCQAFQEMGYRSERNHEISTIRGKVKVDVFAVDERNPIPTTILCECKHWNKPVDQGIVYAFRSICDDIGAHYGLIISQRGFQSGAETTRTSTNIHLLDFNQFQSTFFEKWREGVFMILVQLYDKLLPLWRFEFDIFINSPEEEQKNWIRKIFEKYSIFCGGNQRYTKYFVESNKFPIKIIDPRGELRIPEQIATPFRLKSPPCSDPNRHPIPEQNATPGKRV